ncbi:MAG: aspartate-semialdehyde dehydrogenase [Phycisphaerae bacterium]
MALNVTVVGIGLVGEELVRCLREREFPCTWPPRIAATRTREEEVAGETMTVHETTEQVFEGTDLVLFAGTEGASGASVQWRPTAEAAGAISIDNGKDFRMADDVPLVVPEVNADAVTPETTFIASPNCSTIQMVVALAPIREAAGIRRVHVATYQATSGTGRRGPEELAKQTPGALESRRDIPFDPDVYGRPIAFNCVPEIGSFKDDDYTTEELKMDRETRKIFGDPSLAVSATCVRVPTFDGHAEAVWVETERPLSADEAREALRAAPGVRLMDEPTDDGRRTYPVPLDVDAGPGRDLTMVGRVRRDPSVENGLALWCVAHNLRKGAALNVVEIAENLVERGILKA